MPASCFGHDFDECALQAIRKFRSEPRRAGKHKWQVIWCSMAVSDASDRPEQSASNLSGRGSSMDLFCLCVHSQRWCRKDAEMLHVDWCVFDRARAGLSGPQGR